MAIKKTSELRTYELRNGYTVFVGKYGNSLTRNKGDERVGLGNSAQFLANLIEDLQELFEEIYG